MEIKYKLEHITTIKKVDCFIQNKLKNEILIASNEFSIIDYSGKIIYYEEKKLIIEFEYEIGFFYIPQIILFHNIIY